jgi:hypothetical protein
MGVKLCFSGTIALFIIRGPKTFCQALFEQLNSIGRRTDELADQSEERRVNGRRAMDEQIARAFRVSPFFHPC